jgi:hypothetical protein
MPPDRRLPRGGRLGPSVLGALWCKPHPNVPQRVPLQCARPWGGEAGPSRQWRGVSPPNGTGRCWSHGPGERCRRVNTNPAIPSRQETPASLRPFGTPRTGARPGVGAAGRCRYCALWRTPPPTTPLLAALQCARPGGGAGAGPCWSHGPMPIAAGGRPPAATRWRPRPDHALSKAGGARWTGARPWAGSSRQWRSVSPPNGAARALSPSTIHAGESKSGRTSCT